jgi:hypothetical protein
MNCIQPTKQFFVEGKLPLYINVNYTPYNDSYLPHLSIVTLIANLPLLLWER